MNFYKRYLLAFGMILFTLGMYSCESKDPAILKVYVRSKDYMLVEGGYVRIIGDTEKGTSEYFDEKRTNSSGVAIFNLDDLFSTYSKDQEKVAYFTVYARDTVPVYTISKAKAKAHLTSTVTINLTD